jgi:hypothetical protein
VLAIRARERVVRVIRVAIAYLIAFLLLVALVCVP